MMNWGRGLRPGARISLHYAHLIYTNSTFQVRLQICSNNELSDLVFRALVAALRPGFGSCLSPCGTRDSFLPYFLVNLRSFPS